MVKVNERISANELISEETKIFIEICDKIQSELLSNYPEHKVVDAMLSTSVRLAGRDVIEMAEDYLEAVEA